MDIRADSRSERAPLTFHYEFTVRNVSHGERMRVWIPLAHSDAFQEVRVTSQYLSIRMVAGFAEPVEGKRFFGCGGWI
jgi:hypothetical protein